ncbi:hypothetical protein Cylst_2374 [Cylindrospermum stagnale PCC 7417]|uniref:Uncharacterized protein n=1 Tax=Cylindrospermum stagnale PCC 7417 TaxID=56107 RepID=K9WWN5_9NOST|nr:hypothetical protein [Cylindrospermum stagnale]AFZ24598.1 hypothetical protein Cylst_2374 [Cylindrospermum stagnale PCC 7417]
MMLKKFYLFGTILTTISLGHISRESALAAFVDVTEVTPPGAPSNCEPYTTVFPGFKYKGKIVSHSGAPYNLLIYGNNSKKQPKFLYRVYNPEGSLVGDLFFIINPATKKTFKVTVHSCGLPTKNYPIIGVNFGNSTYKYIAILGFQEFTVNNTALLPVEVSVFSKFQGPKD